MFVGFDGTFVGTEDGPGYSPPGIVAKIPRKDIIVDIRAIGGPLVFRRYRGD